MALQPVSNLFNKERILLCEVVFTVLQHQLLRLEKVRPGLTHTRTKPNEEPLPALCPGPRINIVLEVFLDPVSVLQALGCRHTLMLSGVTFGASWHLSAEWKQHALSTFICSTFSTFNAFMPAYEHRTTCCLSWICLMDSVPSGTCGVNHLLDLLGKL